MGVLLAPAALALHQAQVGQSFTSTKYNASPSTSIKRNEFPKKVFQVINYKRMQDKYNIYAKSIFLIL